MAVQTAMLLATVALPIAIYLFKILSVAFEKDLKSLPGPWLSRFTNIPLKLALLSGQKAMYIHRLHQKYGPVVRVAPTEVSFADIEVQQQIHRIGTPFRKAEWYQKGSPAQSSDETAAVFGLRDHKQAQARRRLFQRAGTKAIVVQWEPRIVEIVNQAVHRIKSAAERGTVDMFKWWQFMATDIVGEIAFGEPFRMVELDQIPPLVKDVQTSMMLAAVKLELPLMWFIMKAVPLRICQDAVNIFYRFTKYGQVAVANTKKAGKGTLFSKMVPEDGSEQMLPDSLIAEEAANIIIAGSDTTSATLTFLTYAVLKDPGIKAKLLAELETCSADPSWEELEALPYLQNVITETLRLYTAVPGALVRETPAGGASMGGYSIPGGTVVVADAYTFHRDPSVFSNPEKFDPDRWINPTPAMKAYFMPFGGMARICLGQNVARLEMLHAVSKFFRACPDARLADNMTPEAMEVVEYFVIKPKGGRCEITTQSKSTQS